MRVDQIFKIYFGQEAQSIPSARKQDLALIKRNFYSNISENPHIPSATMAEQQQQLQALSEQYQKFEQGGLYCLDRDTATNLYFTELQSHIQSRQRLESQQQENKGVQKVPSMIPQGRRRAKKVGIRRIERRCEYLQAGWASLVKAGQNRSGSRGGWKTGVH